MQEVGIAVDAIHCVGMVHALSEEGSQQPWTPKYVFVAHIAVGFSHVTDDTMERFDG